MNGGTSGSACAQETLLSAWRGFECHDPPSYLSAGVICQKFFFFLRKSTRTVHALPSQTRCGTLKQVSGRPSQANDPNR